MPARSKICCVDFVWRKNIHLAHDAPWSSRGQRLAQQTAFRREFFGHHLISEGGDDRDTLVFAGVEIIFDIWMVKMLVDIGHDNPVRGRADFLSSSIPEPRDQKQRENRDHCTRASVGSRLSDWSATRPGNRRSIRHHTRHTVERDGRNAETRSLTCRHRSSTEYTNRSS